LALDHRDIAGDNDERAGPAAQLVARSHNSMARPALLGLQDELEVQPRSLTTLDQARGFQAHRLLDCLRLMPDDRNNRVGCLRRRGLHDERLEDARPVP
jgi:hypothetical protein